MKLGPTGRRGALTLSLASLLLSLALLETGLRLGRPVASMAPPEAADDPWRTLLHRRSPIPGLAYELVPGARSFAQGAVIETNSLGMRDAEPLDAATPGLTRIAALGDSFTFGFGVPAESTYPEVLERLLTASGREQGRRFEVLNMGVGGYSTPDEELVLRYKALDLAPKLVLVGYFLNDPEIDPIQPLQAYFHPVKWWQHSHLLRLLAATRRLGENGAAGPDYFYALHDPAGRKWKSVEAAFARMHADAAPRDVPVVVVIIPEPPLGGWDRYAYDDLHLQIAAAARSAGLDVLDLLPRFREEDALRLRVIPGDHHLSPAGHDLAARAIFDKLRADYAARLGL